PFFEFDRYKLNRQGEPSHSFLNLRNILDVILNALLDEEAEKLYNARKPLVICKKYKVFSKDESLRSIDP
ncbi:hypothetical protein, partial [Leptospira adleri]|uniref:hypothetical protein n=1 Tax=Leptospira adleri TaxID=2023186 RepID=UPI001A9C9A99